MILPEEPVLRPREPGPTADEVSVIIPSHNRRATLDRALTSIFAQTAVPGEVILVDDGSTDGTASWLRTNWPSVRCIARDRGGVSAARNSGIRAARGNWLAFLDSDDAWSPEKNAVQLAALNENLGYRIAHADEIWIRRGVRVNPMNKHAKSGGWIFERCLPRCVISPSSVVIRRTVFDEVGLFDETLPACEDYDMWLRICAREPVLFINRPLIEKYGGHADQLSRKFWGMDRFRVRALEKLLTNPQLTPAMASAARRELGRKLTILANGARKRGKERAAADYDRRRARAVAAQG